MRHCVPVSTTRVAAADNLVLYGIITSGTLSRICTYASVDANYVVTAAEDLTGALLTCNNAPDAFVVNPPDLGGFVGWGESYRVSWEFAWDFGEAAGAQDITLFLGDVDMRGESTFDGTYGTVCGWFGRPLQRPLGDQLHRRYGWVTRCKLLEPPSTVPTISVPT